MQKNKSVASHHGKMDAHVQNSPSKSGKKTNFVPLFGTDGKDRTAAKLPGEPIVVGWAFHVDRDVVTSQICDEMWLCEDGLTKRFLSLISL